MNTESPDVISFSHNEKIYILHVYYKVGVNIFLFWEKYISSGAWINVI